MIHLIDLETAGYIFDLASIMKEVREKWGDDVQYEDITIEVHELSSDGGYSLHIVNNNILKHLIKIRDGLNAYWKEGGTDPAYEDLSEIHHIFKQLMVERGLIGEVPRLFIMDGMICMNAF